MFRFHSIRDFKGSKARVFVLSRSRGNTGLRRLNVRIAFNLHREDFYVRNKGFRLRRFIFKSLPRFAFDGYCFMRIINVKRILPNYPRIFFNRRRVGVVNSYPRNCFFNDNSGDDFYFHVACQFGTPIPFRIICTGGQLHRFRHGKGERRIAITSKTRLLRVIRQERR